MPRQPASDACQACTALDPKWVELRTATWPTPHTLAFSMASVLARAAATVPLLRKDFITDEVQLLEARAFGASAVLLIARALPHADLDRLAKGRKRQAGR